MKQTILGAGGAIGTLLAKDLKKYTDEIRLVSRNPKKVNPDDEVISADLTNQEQVLNAVAGSEIVYLLVGIHYSLKEWEAKWHIIMQNTINACIAHNAKLVFFDNVYMYDISEIPLMTEESKINPPSQKGKVRSRVAKMLLDAIKEKKLTALIARSADFYGPKHGEGMMLHEMVFKNLASGKKANWLIDTTFKHTFTYTPDAAKATALLANTPDAYNQIWHLPTTNEILNGKELLELIANEMKVNLKMQIVPKWLVKVMGFFMPIMSEIYEMLYQYDRDYIFSSKKFEDKFGIKATPIKQAIKEIIEIDYKK